jgi:hypothetical protein
VGYVASVAECHLRQELTVEEAEAWRRLSREEQLSPRYRESFKQAGWAFSGSVLDVRHCPCCVYNVENLKQDPDKIAMKAAIVEFLGDDEDAIAAIFEEEGL